MFSMKVYSFQSTVWPLSTSVNSLPVWFGSGRAPAGRLFTDFSTTCVQPHFTKVAQTTSFK
jgi:hypothetical protein